MTGSIDQGQGLIQHLQGQRSDFSQTALGMMCQGSRPQTENRLNQFKTYEIK